MSARKEMKDFLKTHSRPTYIFRLGMLTGILLTLIILGLSFVRPYINYILNYFYIGAIPFGLYAWSKWYKLRKLEKQLEDK